MVHADGMGHVLVLDGVPGFKADFDGSTTTITQNVRLAPGHYLMHCIIPGHTQAGEEAVIVVT